MKILILNASPQGKNGNCALFWARYWPKQIPYEVIHLAETKMAETLFKKVLAAPAVVFTTGTYWDSWGSPLQEFFEAFTKYEAHPKILGKPAACLVLMHAVGGKSLLSRLQGVLNTFGFLIPPMSGIVYSLVNQEALQKKNSHAEDMWQPQDLPFVLTNLLNAAAFSKQIKWENWPVDHKDAGRIWLKT